MRQNNHALERQSSKPQMARGRERQLWDGNVRLCCMTLPMRSCEDNARKAEILLITSRKKGDYVFPRGGWDNDETKIECARRETLEEAGVVGNIIATFGSFIKPSPKGYNTKIYVYIMEVNQVHERWAEEDERKRLWVPVDKVLDHLTRPDLVKLWTDLLTCCQKNSDDYDFREDVAVHNDIALEDKKGKRIHHMFSTLRGLFERRKVPMAMRPKTRIPFLLNVDNLAWLDEHFPLATTVRGQPGSKKPPVRYLRPWSYFIVYTDGSIVEYIDRKRPVPRDAPLLELLRNQALRSLRRTWSEPIFKFLWVLNKDGEFLVTEEYIRSHEKRPSNHGDLVPAQISECINDCAIENTDLQGEYRGIARMGGELIFSPKNPQWILNNISGFSLARVNHRVPRIPSKREVKSDHAASMEPLQYEQLHKLRDYLAGFIHGMEDVILFSGDIGGTNLKKNSFGVKMDDLLIRFFRIHAM